MKILKEGTMPQPEHAWWVGLKVTCSLCGAVVEIESDDRYIKDVHLADTFVQLKCPTVGPDGGRHYMNRERRSETAAKAGDS